MHPSVKVVIDRPDCMVHFACLALVKQEYINHFVAFTLTLLLAYVFGTLA